MKRGLLKFFAAIGALIGAGFAVLLILKYYDIFDYIEFLKKAGYYIYILIGIAGLFAIFELAVLFSRKPKAPIPDSDTKEDATLPAAHEDFSSDNGADKSSALALKSLKSAKLVPDDEPAGELERFLADIPNKEIVLQSPAPVELPKFETPVTASLQSDAFGADWAELNRMIDPEELEEIRYTGQKADDILDLDDEFVIRSTDEAVAPTPVQNQAQSVSQRQKPEPAHSSGDVDYIIGKINEIIDLVTEREGKK